MYLKQKQRDTEYPAKRINKHLKTTDIAGHSAEVAQASDKVDQRCKVRGLETYTFHPLVAMKFTWKLGLVYKDIIGM